MLADLTSVTPVVRFPVGILAAVVAVGIMDLAMARIPEGTTPPFVAASVLTERTIHEAPARLATTVHYLAGLGTGALFVYLSLLSESLIGASPWLSVAVTGVGLYTLMVGFFLVVPLPRAIGLGSTRRANTARGWAVAAAVYVAVLVPVSTGLTLLFV